jgi:hypothetical protein
MIIEVVKSSQLKSEDHVDKDFGLVFHLPKTLIEVKSKIKEALLNETVLERHNTVVPFLELKIKNAHSIYAITKSYIDDLKLNKKNFGFTAHSDLVDDKVLLGLGSCISYSNENMPVMLVVNNLMESCWDPYRKYFTPGLIGQWKSYEWGNLCLIDYNEILSKSMNSTQIDFKVINDEFGAVLWTLPPVKQSVSLKQFYISVFKQLDSVALVVPKLPASFEEVRKVEKFYSSMGVPLKGILNGDKS